jgi:hypothetical protein
MIKKIAIGIFLDLKKAFDVCSHSILLHKLKKLGIDSVLLPENLRAHLQLSV